MSAITVSQICLYPVKSAAGLDLTTATVEPRGIVGDRRWMLINAAGKFLTQRQFPQLAQLQVRVTPLGLDLSVAGVCQLSVPIPTHTSDQIVEVWGDRCLARAAPTEVNNQLSQWLGQPCQLVYMPESSDRRATHPRTQTQQPVSFADGYPLLLISAASLADLNQRLDAPVPMNRFRPNLVVSGCAAFAEDTWQTIRIGTVTLDVVKPCSRCIITTTDQQTGQRYREPLRTLATYRAWDGKIWFGQNVMPMTAGEIQLGDRVEVLATAE